MEKNLLERGFARTGTAKVRMVGLGRLELPTSPLSGVRSSHLSYRPNVLAGITLTRPLIR